MKYTLYAERILLRPLKMTDLDELYEIIMKNPSLPYYMSWELPKSKEETAEHLGEAIEKQKNEEMIRWGIFYKDELIGMISLSNITRKLKKWTLDTAELGYWVIPNYEGIGFATKAGKAVLEFGFTKMDLHKITVGHISENIASQRVIEKLGFRYIGEQKQHCFYDEKWWDHKIYEFLVDDFVKPV